MDIPVLVELVANNGYRAQSGTPVPLSAEGATAEEAVARLKVLLNDRLATGARLMTVTVAAASDNPWLRVAGMFKDDPLFDECLEAIAARRRQIDADPDVP